MSAPSLSRAQLSIPRKGPWDLPGALYFYGGALSSFAPTPGLVLPESWHGHPNPAPVVPVPTVEHWFQASKASCRQDFFWVLSAPSARSAKRRGGCLGERGRTITLRPDWEQIKFAVMRYAHTRKHELPLYREELPATGEDVLVEDSPTDYIWGGRDRRGGYEGRNLLGIALMEVRAALAS
jgi:ribA/ribD-fused uncharacterized protein